MCGIVGISGVAPADRAVAMRDMRELLVHRGPDSGGEHVDEHTALGIRRLRVIDLITGDQPIANEDGTVWTVFNGEIYNFRELRELLVARGHRFRTAADTEVIVHLYEDHGDRFVEHLDGMFALALWDAASETLVLARDRMGKKPLLYAERDGEISFASEHAALLAWPALSREPDPLALRAYLRLGFVPAPRDAFKGVQKLLPAHVLVWRGGRSVTRRYWALPPAGTSRLDEREATLRVRALVSDAVRKRLVADVPVGAFLSGGVDSSAVVATMASLTSSVRTFSIGFEETEYSELAHARRIAERFGTDHHEFVVRPLQTDVLPELVRHYGEPYADSSALPTYYVSKLTRQHVTVALNGDGGDEVFAGYERYVAARMAASLDRLPAPVRVGAAAVAEWLLPDSLSPRSPTRRARRFFTAAALPPRERYLRWLGVFDRGQLTHLLAPEFNAATASLEAEEPFRDDSPCAGRDAVVESQRMDMALYKPEDKIVKVDIASMANSLEVRSPLLDTALVEFATTLPTSLKIRGGDRKYLFKRAFADLVPAENMYRRKQGFALPVGDWFRGELRPYVEDTVLSATALGRGYFRPSAVIALVRDHAAGRADHAQRLWALLMLELWHCEFVDA